MGKGDSGEEMLPKASFNPEYRRMNVTDRQRYRYLR